MKIKPLGTLFSRLALLLILAVVSSQAFTLWLTVRQRDTLLGDQLYAQVVNTLADLEDMLDSLPADQRSGFLIGYNRPGLPQLLPLTAAEQLSFDKRVPSLGMRLAARLAAGLGEPIEVRMRSEGERHELWISVQVVDQHYWLVMPLGGFLGPALSPTLIAAGVVSLLALLAAFWLAWRVTRPLIRLSHATRELETGGTPKPIPLSGPQEVRGLTERFNSMTQALQAAASERRLMLAGLSHDLRTPLTRLKLMVELQPECSDQNAMLEDIDELSRIVRQFIDFARSEETRKSEPVQLAELADSVVGRFAREGLEISLLHHSDPERQADALALERMLSNLIDNARRYGTTPITVVVGERHGWAELTVLDRGQGIPPAQRSASLAPFERLAEHRGNDGGSGLGLAIVARIVKQHNGVLEFIDPPDGGFGIRVRLPPLAKEVEVASGAHGKLRLSEVSAKLRPGKKT
jgi:two-component system osmolarity sensor histidine kinase EnvZ